MKNLKKLKKGRRYMQTTKFEKEAHSALQSGFFKSKSSQHSAEYDITGKMGDCIKQKTLG